MIKYPFNFENENENDEENFINYKNRGLSFEKMINDSNKYYVFHDIALIYKKPTPIHVVKINKEQKITDAYFEKPSTTDYNGLYKGKYIDFEAKETKSKTSFALSNIHLHQIKHLKKVDEMGGIAFLFIYFSALDKVFIYFIKDYITYFKNNEDKKSIPLNELIKNGYELEISLYPPLDYLKIIDQNFSL